MSHTLLRTIIKVIVILFAIIGLLLTGMYFAIRFGWTNNPGAIDRQQEVFLQGVTHRETEETQTHWQDSEEWNVLSSAIVKDKAVIMKAANTAKIEPRILVSVLIVEQLRLFYSDRSLFEIAFAPLKVLGNQSVMSWGVMGIKPHTAIQIEEYLLDKDAAFYLGENSEHLLDFKTPDIVKERFERLTNSTDRYYSYLYASLALKELEAQWKTQGFPIDDQPGILATLYNLGFEKSVPKADPKIGGADIEIGQNFTTFGGLALDFYKSDKLLDLFPRNE